MSDAADLTGVLMALITIGILDKTEEYPERRPVLERETNRRFAWKYGKEKYLITVTGPFISS